MMTTQTIPEKTTSTPAKFAYGATVQAVGCLRDKSLDPKLSAATDLEVATHLNKLLGPQSAKLIEVWDAERQTPIWLARIQLGEAGRGIVILRRDNTQQNKQGLVCTGSSDMLAVHICSYYAASRHIQSGRWVVGEGVAVELAKPLLSVAVTPPPAEVAPGPTPARGGTTSERTEYAKYILRTSPDVTAVTVSEQVRARFGTGMSGPRINEIRAEVDKERRRIAVRETVPARVVNVVNVVNASSLELAKQLVEAVEAQKTAEVILAKARARVSALMDQLAGPR